MPFQQIEVHQVRVYQSGGIGAVLDDTNAWANDLPRDVQGRPVVMDPDKIPTTWTFVLWLAISLDLVVLALGILGILWIARRALNRYLKGSNTGTIPDTMPNTMPPNVAAQEAPHEGETGEQSR